MPTTAVAVVRTGRSLTCELRQWHRVCGAEFGACYPLDSEERYVDC